MNFENYFINVPMLFIIIVVMHILLMVLAIIVSSVSASTKKSFVGMLSFCGVLVTIMFLLSIKSVDSQQYNKVAEANTYVTRFLAQYDDMKSNYKECTPYEIMKFNEEIKDFNSGMEYIKNYFSSNMHRAGTDKEFIELIDSIEKLEEININRS